MFDPVFSKILVAFDGSDASKRALDHAAKMAAMFEGDLHIITVVPRVTLPPFSNAEIGASIDIRDYQRKMEENYNRAIEEAKAGVMELYPHLKVEADLVKGRPSSIIVNKAKDLDVSLIIMGSRGLGGISGWILGSTSRQVVDQCTKPILIVK